MEEEPLISMKPLLERSPGNIYLAAGMHMTRVCVCVCALPSLMDGQGDNHSHMPEEILDKTYLSLSLLYSHTVLHQPLI